MNQGVSADAQLRLLRPSLDASTKGKVRLYVEFPVVMGHLKSAPLKYAIMTPKDALEYAESIIHAVRLAQ